MIRKLLFSVTKKDFKVQTFRAGGKGGQKQNKTESGVRIIHKESGAVGESREQRSQVQNKKLAFSRLVDSCTFQTWLKVKASYNAKAEQEIKQKVERDMKTKNIKIEIRDGKKWVEETF